MMDGISYKVTGSFLGSFEKLSQQMPDIERGALYHAAYGLRDKIRESLISSVPKATTHNPKYDDTLADAIAFTRVDGASTTVHALGNRKKGSGTFRTRFFEGGTKDRYQKSYAGVKLKKKRNLGHIGPTHFFSKAVEANRNYVVQLMDEVISKYVKQIIEEN